MCGFIAQLVEHRTGIAEVTGSSPFEALIFFRLLLSSCLNWKIYCDDHTSLSFINTVEKWGCWRTLCWIQLSCQAKIWIKKESCDKEYFTQLVRNTTTVLNCDSNWNRLPYKEAYFINALHLPSTKDSNPAENFAFFHGYYFLFRFFIVINTILKSYLVRIFYSDDGIALTEI